MPQKIYTRIEIDSDGQVISADHFLYEGAMALADTASGNQGGPGGGPSINNREETTVARERVENKSSTFGGSNVITSLLGSAAALLIGGPIGAGISVLSGLNTASKLIGDLPPGAPLGDVPGSAFGGDTPTNTATANQRKIAGVKPAETLGSSPLETAGLGATSGAGKKKKNTGGQSTVLSSVGTGGSLGAG